MYLEHASDQVYKTTFWWQKDQGVKTPYCQSQGSLDSAKYVALAGFLANEFRLTSQQWIHQGGATPQWWIRSGVAYKYEELYKYLQKIKIISRRVWLDQENLFGGEKKNQSQELRAPLYPHIKNATIHISPFESHEAAFLRDKVNVKFHRLTFNKISLTTVGLIWQRKHKYLRFLFYLHHILGEFLLCHVSPSESYDSELPSKRFHCGWELQ